MKSFSRYQPKQAVYLDYCATTPVDIRTLGAYENTCRNIWGNPSSFHGVGQSAFDLLENKRKEIALSLKLENVNNLYFSSNTVTALTSLLNILLQTDNYQLITTEIEHNSIYLSLDYVSEKCKKIEKLSVNEEGKIDLAVLESLLKRDKSIILYSPVNHETGSIQDFKEIYFLAEKYDSIVVFDAIQAIVRIKPEEWTGYCHCFVLSSHKLYSPKGTVVLYISPEIGIPLDENSCNQESGLFPGTENLPSISSFAEAMKIYRNEIEQDLNHIKLLTDEAYKIFDDSSLDYIKESPDDGVPGIINISLIEKDISMEELFLFLYKEKICISRFSACTAKLDGPSLILESMGRTGRRVNQSLRISLGRNSRRNDIFALTGSLKKFLLQI